MGADRRSTWRVNNQHVDCCSSQRWLSISPSTPPAPDQRLTQSVDHQLLILSVLIIDPYNPARQPHPTPPPSGLTIGDCLFTWNVDCRSGPHPDDRHRAQRYVLWYIDWIISIMGSVGDLRSVQQPRMKSQNVEIRRTVWNLIVSYLTGV